MTSDLDHLEEHSRAVAELPAEERIAWIRRERWIEYSRGVRALDRISELLTHPPRDRMPCLLLHGTTGMGKTRILQKFLRSNPAVFNETTGYTRMSVAAIQMPPHPKELHLYEEILVSLGAVLPYSSSTGTLRHRVRTLCRQMNVRMLVIDEIHCLLAGTYREQRIILNCIRFLANDLRIPIICAGTDEAKTALLTDEQLADRFEAFELAPWRDDTDFHQLLVSYAALLPLRRPSQLRDAKVRKRLLAMSDGVTIRICRLLEDAAVTAILALKTLGLHSENAHCAAALYVPLPDSPRTDPGSGLHWPADGRRTPPPNPAKTRPFVFNTLTPQQPQVTAPVTANSPLSL